MYLSVPLQLQSSPGRMNFCLWVCQIPMEYVVLQSVNGYFLKFLKEEVPYKKKTAIGVRGIRLGEKDALEEAYLLENRSEYTIVYKDKEVTLNKLKLAKRDTKGTKIRV